MRIRIACAPAAALALVLWAGAALPADVAGKVVNVHDGDTLTLLVERHQVRVRLVDIDAPELAQAYGRRSRDSLAELCAGHAAVVSSRGRDKYKRLLGRVSCDGVDANAEQVRRGMAWVFDRYVADRSLYGLQNDARAVRRGLWSQDSPVAPWEWRHGRKTAHARRAAL